MNKRKRKGGKEVYVEDGREEMTRMRKLRKRRQGKR